MVRVRQAGGQVFAIDPGDGERVFQLRERVAQRLGRNISAVRLAPDAERLEVLRDDMLVSEIPGGVDDLKVFSPKVCFRDQETGETLADVQLIPSGAKSSACCTTM
ncbi:unnamed protein product [Prorocentrum cordatum]|uniref:Ubiquitin-like domain-containing protein n=1 Tax=Prorocentrum cordatum TaxID=2364126 RepID=A0ABN9XIU6_9DINO|nr:unnamed protein product [Polarella glacialis]